MQIGPSAPQGPSVPLRGSVRSAGPRKRQRLSGKLLSNKPVIDLKDRGGREAESHYGSPPMKKVHCAEVSDPARRAPEVGRGKYAM